MLWYKQLAPPEFEDPQDQLRAQILVIILWTAAFGAFFGAFNIYLASLQDKGWGGTFYRLLISGCLDLTSLFLLYRRKLFVAGLLLLINGLAFISVQMIDYQGIHDAVVLLYPLFFIIASLLLSRWWYLFFWALSLVIISIIGIFELNGIIDSPIITEYRNNGSLLTELINIIIIFVVSASGIQLIVKHMWANLTQAQTNEKALHEANRLLDQRVRERTADLENANQELEAFAYSVSHDLRAPLRSISGFSRILIDECEASLDPTSRNYLERISASAVRMDQLINDLLEFSRLSRQPLRKGNVDLGKIARQVLEELQPAPEQRQATIMMGDLPPCSGDAALLRLVLINLVSNALKFTRSRLPAIIEIGGTVFNENPVYFVRDNGIGFNMAYVDKLFGVFQRLHRPDEYEGTGIGLATVRRIIHRHGGKVWAEGAEGEGATFYFMIP